MDSPTQITFDYNNAIRQAQKLEGIASSVKSLGNAKMNGVESNLRGAWNSDSSSAYFKKMTRVQGEIQTTARNLSKIAASIRDIAKINYDAEMEAWRIANERKEE